MPIPSRRSRHERGRGQGTRRAMLAALGAAALASTAAGCGIGKDLADSVLGGSGEDTTAPADGGEVTLTILPGSTTEQIANQLRDAGVIRSALAFRLRARQQGLDSALQAGEHVLRRDMSVDEALAALQRAYTPEQSLTLIEGWRREEMAAYFQAKGMLDAHEFLTLTSEGSNAFTHDFLAERPAGASLEGYLFPDTYRVLPDTTTRGFVQRLLDQFGKQVSGGVREGIRSSGLSLHEAVTLAAIIEREAQVAAERPLIAGVFFNRLRVNMPLGACTTIQYALGYQEAEGRWWKQILSYADLEVASPYNTYRLVGLPPGPICNPGLGSLQAVAAPEATDYYYFVATGDGSHAFSRTLDEHNANVRKYQPFS